MGERFDAIVVGTGAGGVTVAHGCAEVGLKVASIDARPYGGTCMLRGCDPKKVLVGAAEVIERQRAMKDHGITGDAVLDWPELMTFRATFTDAAPALIENGLKNAGVTTYHGKAVFTSKNMLNLEGLELEAEHIVLATGARPRPLGISGEGFVSTSEDFLYLEQMPKRVLFVGGGYISFELAHIARAAGAEVTIVHRSAVPLGGFDPDLVNSLMDSYLEQGINIQLNAPASAIRKGENGLVLVADEEYEADLIVHGAGRVPDLESLDLETAEVEYDNRGILVDPHMRSISNPHVHAVGDCAAVGIPLTPVASYQGAVAVADISEQGSASFDPSGIPTVAYTSPPIATVGLSQAEAEASGLDFEVHLSDSSSWFTHRRIGIEHGAAKVIVGKGSGQILGAHLMGHNADEVINVFALAIRSGLSTTDLDRVTWTYPTSTSDINYLY